MSAKRRLPARAGLLVLVCLAGCGIGDDAQRRSEAAGSVAAARARPGLERGELLALACEACHTLGRGADHSIGPNLFGFLGRPAGAREGFAYSDALREADFVWTAERLDAWLAAPTDYLPGTTMTFTGYASASDRAALIEYLRAATTPQADAGETGAP